MITFEQAKALKPGEYIHSLTKTNADGTPMRARVISVKTWKRTPDKVRIRAKHGLYDYCQFLLWSRFDHNELHNFALGYGS